jgi:hypothetical protein
MKHGGERALESSPVSRLKPLLRGAGISGCGFQVDQPESSGALLGRNDQSAALI